jgi:hypothetical protein
MDRTTFGDARPAIEAVLRRLDAWRRDEQRGRRIPDDVWRDASQPAREHGVHPIARALRLKTTA